MKLDMHEMGLDVEFEVLDIRSISHRALNAGIHGVSGIEKTTTTV